MTMLTNMVGFEIKERNVSFQSEFRTRSDEICVIGNFKPSIFVSIQVFAVVY